MVTPWFIPILFGMTQKSEFIALFFFHCLNFVFLDFLGVIQSGELEDVKSGERENCGKMCQGDSNFMKRNTFTTIYLISCAQNNDYMNFKDLCFTCLISISVYFIVLDFLQCTLQIWKKHSKYSYNVSSSLTNIINLN